MLNQIDLSRVDLNLLVLFEVVMRERNVARAAARLNLSASAVSHGLGRLRRLLNDPLFLRTPKGVAPTDRAIELQSAILDVLERVRGIVAIAEPFDAATSTRRFTLGAPDAYFAVFLPGALSNLWRAAPLVDLSMKQVLPTRAGVPGWEAVLADLEARAYDAVVVPIDKVPDRFLARPLFIEDFVVAVRAGHPFVNDATLETYCQMRHVVVSQTGDATSVFDEVLEGMGRTRRVALTVPNFMLALAVVAETDLLASLPRRLVAAHARRFGLTSVELPIKTAFRSEIRAVVPKAAMMDEGVAWLFGVLSKTSAVDGASTA